jgi:hypothetical protein
MGHELALSWLIVGLVWFAWLQFFWDFFNQIVALFVFFTKYHDMDTDQELTFSDRCHQLRRSMAIWLFISMIGTTVIVLYL